MTKLGNLNFEYIHSGLQTEGYFYDNYFDDGDKMRKQDRVKTYIEARSTCSTESGSKRRYEFAFIPYNGFLNSPELLMKDCELKLSFDRANPKIALTQIDPSSVAPTEIKIIDCVAITEYVSSPNIRNFFDTIETQPLTYEYEDMEVLIKTLPKDSKNIQIII